MVSQNGASLFPNFFLQLGVQTGPTSIMSISVYPSQDSADKVMKKRDEVYKEKADRMSGWSMEGPVRHWNMPALIPILGKL